VTASGAALFVGIDLGTGGVRALAVSGAGQVAASASGPADARDAVSWWEGTRGALRELVSALGRDAALVQAICVDGTSGTVVGVDAHGDPTTSVMAYDDLRATEEAAELVELARERAFLAPTASTSLARIRWLERHEPDAFVRTQRFLHQSELVTARLLGAVGPSDASNALKAGFDPASMRWPEWLEAVPELRARLPEVVSSGTVLGELPASVAGDLGLPHDVGVVAGMTDGTAGFLASGARRAGDDSTTLGATLVFKRLAREHLKDPAGLLYSHRLPDGSWLPGAASNTGAAWTASAGGGGDLARLDAAALAYLPCEHLAYPLRASGERFPFSAPGARGFCEPPTEDPVVRHAAHLQGTALLERLAYEVLDGVVPASGEVYTTGGGSRSDVWTQLRADVTGRTYHRPAVPESAFGSAVLAAAAVVHGGLWPAVDAMVAIERTFRPDPARHERLSTYHRRFRAALERRGYRSLPTP
jgi:sugar (pentulose or hexulose) kinase